MSQARASRARHTAPGVRAHVRAFTYHSSLRWATRLMDLGSRGSRGMPPRLRYRLADAVTTPLALLWPRQRLIEANFARMLSEPARSPHVRALARASVRNYGRMAMDFLAVRTMPQRDVLRWASSAGEEYFRAATRDGHGAIFALPHVGSWDVALAFAQAYGLHLTVVTENNWVTSLVAGSRRQHGVTLAPRDQTRSLRVLFAALKRNECVVLLSDIANRGVQTLDVPFFGAPAPFPTGPARLAQRAGSPILVITSVKLADGTYRIAAQEPLRANRSQPAERETERLTAAIADGFARVIAAFPAQWYPFHPVWPEPAPQLPPVVTRDTRDVPRVAQTDATGEGKRSASNAST